MSYLELHAAVGRNRSLESSAIRLSDAHLDLLSGGLGGFGASNADCTDGSPYPGHNSGEPPHFRPAALRDHPGSTAMLGGYVDWPVAQRPQDLGRRVLVRLGLGRANRAGFPPTASQGYLNRSPGDWPVPPAWGVRVSPDEELRVSGSTQGRY